MLRTVSFCLLIVLQVVTSEPPPANCRRPPPGTKPFECCDLPHVFKEDDFKDCGIEKPSEDDKNLKRGPPDCSKQICLLKKYSLMKDDTDVDLDAATKFMDKWIESNPDFKDAVEIAKEKCLKTDLPGPPQLCQPSKIVFCITNVMFMECPKWADTDDCKKVKEHVEECKAYFP